MTLENSSSVDLSALTLLSVACWFLNLWTCLSWLFNYCDTIPIRGCSPMLSSFYLFLCNLAVFLSRSMIPRPNVLSSRSKCLHPCHLTPKTFKMTIHTTDRLRRHRLLGVSEWGPQVPGDRIKALRALTRTRLETNISRVGCQTFCLCHFISNSPVR